MPRAITSGETKNADTRHPPHLGALAVPANYSALTMIDVHNKAGFAPSAPEPEVDS